MSFKQFHPKIQELIKSKGFEKPTPVQALSFEPIIKGEDILLISPTGSGKMESCFLPILNTIINDKENHKQISVLYITPMRSLNRDMLERMLWWGKKLDIGIT